MKTHVGYIVGVDSKIGDLFLFYPATYKVSAKIISVRDNKHLRKDLHVFSDRSAASLVSVILVGARERMVAEDSIVSALSRVFVMLVG